MKLTKMTLSGILFLALVISCENESPFPDIQPTNNFLLRVQNGTGKLWNEFIAQCEMPQEFKYQLFIENDTFDMAYLSNGSATQVESIELDSFTSPQVREKYFYLRIINNGLSTSVKTYQVDTIRTFPKLAQCRRGGFYTLKIVTYDSMVLIEH
jgi:hypothetical protein